MTRLRNVSSADARLEMPFFSTRKRDCQLGPVPVLDSARKNVTSVSFLGPELTLVSVLDWDILGYLDGDEKLGKSNFEIEIWRSNRETKNLIGKVIVTLKVYLTEWKPKFYLEN